MKKSLILAGILIFAGLMASCGPSMEKDAKLYAKKTAQCLANVDVNDPSTMESAEFEACSKEMEAFEKELDERYKTDEEKEQLGKLYLEALLESDLSKDWKDYFQFIFDLSKMDMGNDDMNGAIDDYNEEDADTDLTAEAFESNTDAE